MKKKTVVQGYTIIKRERAGESMVVIGHNPKAPQPYVTWKAYRHSNFTSFEQGPFWFWNDQQFVPQASVDIPEDFCLESAPFAVKRRGWFVNDEVLIHAWKVDRRAERPWEMVFEALLRCGGNMVIPGTDRNSKKYRDLAAGMGLIITHHHAEPLGAEMFARAYHYMCPNYASMLERSGCAYKFLREDILLDALSQLIDKEIEQAVDAV